MPMERRFTSTKLSPVKLEKRDDAKPIITGYGVVFYDGTPGTEYVLWEHAGERCVERIMTGACNRALAEKQDVRGLFNHSADLILGRTQSGTMQLTIDRTGLKYEIAPGETSVARDVKEHISRGDVTGSSFAFIPTSQKWTETQVGDVVTVVREILDLDLVDVSPVTYPAYTGTTAAVRADGDVVEARNARAAAMDKFKAAADAAKATKAKSERLKAIRERAALVAPVAAKPMLTEKRADKTAAMATARAIVDQCSAMGGHMDTMGPDDDDDEELDSAMADMAAACTACADRYAKMP